jgi:ABC-2 type transport system ATP-binding protein
MNRPIAIDIRSLRVDYGDFTAVNDLTLTVPAGEVFGLVGPNGAGKTSTFRVLATLQEPTYGDVFLAGVDILENRQEARRIMGYMPDLAPVPSDLKVREFLEFYARGFSLGNAAERKQRVDECLEIVAMTDKQQSWCKELSRGQTQRVVLAKTMLPRPKVMILDEPASGLDPLARRDLRLALRAVASQGTTVFISSHILSELAEMCTSICVMNRGKLLASGTAEEVRVALGSDKRAVTAALVSSPASAAAWLAAQPGVSAVQSTETGVTFDFRGSDEAQADLLVAMVTDGHRLRTFEEQRASFEDILVGIAEGNRKAPATQN